MKLVLANRTRPAMRRFCYGGARMTLSITKVDGLFGRLAFLRAAAELRREPQFTPDVSIDFLSQTSPRNPFFKHAETEFYIAKRDGKIAGRAAATVDRKANEVHNEKVVNFGFLEFDVNDRGAPAALVDAAAAFGRSRGMLTLRGPIDMNANHKVGLLLNCYNDPPAMLMPWNPPEYVNAIESLGFVKEKDVIAMEIVQSQLDLNRYDRLAKRALERGGFKIRSFNLKEFDRELELVRHIYNTAWADNWGFVPVDHDEFHYQASGLKNIVNPELGCFVEKEGKTAAFTLSVPDVAIAIREIRGRLLPFGWYQLLKRIKTLKRARMILLGILPEYRKSGLDAILYLETSKRGMQQGFNCAEFGWMLEDNEAIIKGCEASGAKITKKYRIYKKDIR